MERNVVKLVLAAAVISFVLSGAIFFTIGWLANDKEEEEDSCTLPALNQQEQEAISLLQQLTRDRWAEFPVEEDLASIDRRAMAVTLEELSREPHIAGKERDEVDLVEFITSQWESFGLDHVETNTYEVLLSYPDAKNPNLITIGNEERNFFTSKAREFLEPPDDAFQGEFVDAFLAYSPSRTEREKDIVYVNYGRKEDFDLLSNPEGGYYTDLTDKLCMVRYGEIFRGNKVKFASEAGNYRLITGASN